MILTTRMRENMLENAKFQPYFSREILENCYLRMSKIMFYVQRVRRIILKFYFQISDFIFCNHILCLRNLTPRLVAQTVKKI